MLTYRHYPYYFRRHEPVQESEPRLTVDRVLLPEWKPFPFWWEDAPPVPAEADILPRCDVAVVGSGYCGLSAALTLAEAGVNVIVLDIGDPGVGASTRNHGHTGGAGKLPANLDKLVGAERAQLIKQDSVRAADYLRALIHDRWLDVDYAQRGRFLAAHSRSAYRALGRKLAGFRDLNLTVELVPEERQRDEIGSDFYFGGITIAEAAALHPAKLHREIRRLAESAGVRICGRASVAAVSRNRGAYELRTSRGTLSADHVVIATNAYTGPVTPYLQRRLIPVTAYMIATEELPDALAQELLPKNRTGGDTKRALYAFRRSPDGKRIIFAGRARFGDVDERSASVILHGFMISVWPQLRDYRISHGWKGFVGFTFDFLPHMGECDGMHFAIGCQGAGLSIMTYLGHQMALKILRRQDRPCGLDGNAFPTLPTYRGHPWFLPIVGAYYNLRDRIDRLLSGRN